MNTIRDLFLNGAQLADFVRESCSRDHAYDGDFYTVLEPMVAYKKLTGVHVGTANIAKLILPAGTTIFAGELFRFIGILPNGRADEDCDYSSPIGTYYREAYEGLNSDVRAKHTN